MWHCLFIFFIAEGELGNFTVYIDGQTCGQVIIGNPEHGGGTTIWCDEVIIGKELKIEKDEYKRLFLGEVVPIFDCH